MSNPSEASTRRSTPEAISAVFERFAPSLELVEGAMREQLGSEAEIVAGLGEHVLSSGGKRMRPALLLIAAELCGYTGPRAVQAGAAIELLHTATLLHDDVVDLSSLRRSAGGQQVHRHRTHFSRKLRRKARQTPHPPARTSVTQKVTLNKLKLELKLKLKLDRALLSRLRVQV